jgi:hypothetical protein
VRYAVIVKPPVARGAACEIYILHASTVPEAAFAVARARNIPQKVDFLRHFMVMSTSELPEGWDGDELGKALVTTDLDAELSAAPGF